MWQITFLRDTRRQLKYRELKAFRKLLVCCTQVSRAFKAVDNGGVIPATERVSNICQVRIQQFT